LGAEPEAEQDGDAEDGDGGVEHGGVLPGADGYTVGCWL
jgi:hypothetical protein